jgi:hypothetical protein
MNSLLKQMKAEKTPQLKKYICLPLLLSPDRDEELLKLTEHRYRTIHGTGELKMLFDTFIQRTCLNQCCVLSGAFFTADPGFGAFLTSGSVIWDNQDPDPG